MLLAVNLLPNRQCVLGAMAAIHDAVVETDQMGATGAKAAPRGVAQVELIF